MPNGNYVAYFRVSTARQGVSGLGLESQKKAVADYLNGGDWRIIAEHTEIESGKRNDRPKLAEAIAEAKKHKATLIIAKLDCLARNVFFISGLMESGIEFVAVDSGMYKIDTWTGASWMCARGLNGCLPLHDDNIPEIDPADLGIRPTKAKDK